MKLSCQEQVNSPAEKSELCLSNVWAIASTMQCCCSWGYHHLGTSTNQDKSSLPKVQGKLKTYPSEVAVTEHNLGMLSGWLCMEPVRASYGGPAMLYTVGMNREWQYFRQSCSSLVEGANVFGELIWCGCKRPALALQMLRSYPSVFIPFFTFCELPAWVLD